MVNLYEKLAIIECNYCCDARKKLNGLESRAENSPRYLKLSHEARRQAIAEVKEAGDPAFADEMIEICLKCDYSKPCIADKLSTENSDEKS